MTRPFRGSWGSHRFRHRGQVRAMKTCSVTSAGVAGSSMTSRVRCTHPPVRAVWHSGQNSGAWVTCAVGSSIRRRAKPWVRFPARLLFFPRRLLAPGGRLMARHPSSRSAAGQPDFQALDLLAQSGDDALLLRDNLQQSFPARLVQVHFCFHSPLMPQSRPWTPPFFR